MGFDAVESKAVRKVNPKYQAITVADEQTAPAAGVYVNTEGKYVIGVETDAAFDGAKVVWYGARTKALADAGTWKAMTWDGAALETTIGASGSSGLDPLKFRTYNFLRPVSDAAQDGAATVIGVILGDLR